MWGWPLGVAVVLGAPGLAMILWSLWPVSRRPRMVARIARIPDRWLNRRWEDATSSLFAGGSLAFGLTFGAVVDRFAPGETPSGRYEELIVVGFGLGVLLIGFGLALRRGRTNLEEEMGTAIVIDEALAGWAKTEHRDVTEAIGKAFQLVFQLPTSGPWSAADTDWDRRIDELVHDLHLLRHLDRPDTPASLYVKAPWPVTLALGSRLNDEGQAFARHRVRVFPPDRRPELRSIPDALRPDAYVALADRESGSSNVSINAQWLDAKGQRLADQGAIDTTRLVIALRVPGTQVGPIVTPDPVHRPQQGGGQSIGLTIMDGDSARPAPTAVLDISSPAGGELDLADQSQVAALVSECLREVLGGVLRGDHQAVLVARCPQEMLLKLGWDTSATSPSAAGGAPTVALEPAVFGGGGFRIVPNLILRMTLTGEHRPV